MRHNYQNHQDNKALPKIGAPDDRFEREADAMADQIMQMPQRFSGQALSAGPASIQRKCAACEQEEEQIRRQPMMGGSLSGGITEGTSALQSQLRSSRGSGQAMPPATQGFMNRAFNTDFSHVRIHTDSRAIRMSQGLQARAFTYGSDIYFNQGQYRPESSEGKHLLGHELTHVVQQSGRRNGVQRSSFSDLTKLQIQRQPTKGRKQSSPNTAQSGSTEPGNRVEAKKEGSRQAGVVVKQQQPQNTALAASCAQTASSLSWANFRKVRRRSKLNANTAYNFSIYKVGKQKVIRVRFNSRASWVKRRYAYPANRKLSGCSRSIAFCQKFFRQVAKVKNARINRYPRVTLPHSNCAAAIRANPAVVARTKAECKTVLGPECDRSMAAESARLLRHERYHFRLACALAKKGTLAILAGQQAARIRRKVIAHARKQSIKFDNDTKHGCDQAQQNSWEATIDAGLPAVQITTSP